MIVQTQAEMCMQRREPGATHVAPAQASEAPRLAPEHSGDQHENRLQATNPLLISCSDTACPVCPARPAPDHTPPAISIPSPSARALLSFLLVFPSARAITSPSIQDRLDDPGELALSSRHLPSPTSPALYVFSSHSEELESSTVRCCSLPSLFFILR